ncbi:TIGR03885 family FMN-dependent LLM class oxidoreductase [Chthonobacter albigriseus]|uniref:TIGR03885 family FMN-dependent LLM class oxidoreductase n=1 Tax=Chthonobacter albigriseus TaxID=1683161 RepID=UPI0015EF757F|nr:TIGR03885 family FMN-dependent LLM class oxidoreductase [Chthonobacter albigriseus]
MTEYGYHASHEQFAPSELVTLVRQAEAAGFDCAMSSDHFHPWSERQGHSGFSFAWLGAAMQATTMPFGVIAAPGYRYHPAIVAQAAATLAEMFEGRFWLALGSGEALNEAITGLPWPDKAERNARLEECASVIRALLSGESVTHRGRVTVVEAKLYSRPKQTPRLLGGAVSEATAARVGAWADGMITIPSEDATLRRVIEAFRANGGSGKPIYLQVALSHAPTEAEAVHMALDQWGPNAIGGEVNWDLRRPADFDAATRFVREADIRQSVLVSADLAWHRDRLAGFAELGFERIFLHHVGRDQARFIDTFGEHVLPALRR